MILLVLLVTPACCNTAMAELTRPSNFDSIEVLTLDQLERAVERNTKLVDEHTKKIAAIETKLETLETKCATCVAPTVGKSVSTLPVVTTEEDFFKQLLGKAVVSNSATNVGCDNCTCVNCTCTNGECNYATSAPRVTSSRIVSVGQPVITSYGPITTRGVSLGSPVQTSYTSFAAPNYVSGRPLVGGYVSTPAYSSARWSVPTTRSTRRSLRSNNTGWTCSNGVCRPNR